MGATLTNLNMRNLTISQRVRKFYERSFKNSYLLYKNELDEFDEDKRHQASTIYLNANNKYFDALKSTMIWSWPIITALYYHGYTSAPIVALSTFIPLYICLPKEKQRDYLIKSIVADPDTLELKITYGENEELIAEFENVNLIDSGHPLLSTINVKGFEHPLYYSTFLFNHFDTDAFEELSTHNEDNFSEIVNVFDQEIEDFEKWRQDMKIYQEKQDEAERNAAKENIKII
jgi:hypothetical protein